MIATIPETESEINGNCLRQDLFPGAFLAFHPVNRCLRLMAVSGVAHPHNLESGLLLSVLHPDQISRSQFVIDSRQECSAAAHVSRNGFLRELHVLGSKTPYANRKLDLDTGLAAAFNHEASL